MMCCESCRWWRREQPEDSHGICVYMTGAQGLKSLEVQTSRDALIKTLPQFGCFRYEGPAGTMDQNYLQDIEGVRCETSKRWHEARHKLSAAVDACRDLRDACLALRGDFVVLKTIRAETLAKAFAADDKAQAVIAKATE